MTLLPTPFGGIVDAHAHVFAAADRIPRVVDDLAPADRHEPVERLLATMNEHGVTSAVLVPLAGEDDYIRRAVQTYPGRFAAVAVATPREQGLVKGVEPTSALLQRRASLPFVALRSSWLAPPGTAVEDSPMFPTLRAMAEQGIALWSYLPPEQLNALSRLVQVLPDLTVVLNHLGFAPNGMHVDEHQRPYFLDALPRDRVDAVLAMSAAPNVHIMLSGLYALSSEPWPYRDLWPMVQQLSDAYGLTRLLWASDYPWPRTVPGYGALIEAAAQGLGDVPADGLDAVFAGNARALFGLAAASEVSMRGEEL